MINLLLVITKIFVPHLLHVKHVWPSLTVSPPADGSSFDQHALAVPVQVVLQVLLFLGLGAELQVNVIGEVCEIAKAFFSAAHTVSQETWKSNICRKCMFKIKIFSCRTFFIRIY